MERQYKIKSLQEIISILDYQSERGNEFYFRGESEDYGETKLTSFGYRWLSNNRKKYDDSEKNYPLNYGELLKLRKIYYSEIGYNLNTREIENFISYCQHHGLPTELIDITENALVSLFFACQDNKNNGFVYCFDKINFYEVQPKYSLIDIDIQNQHLDILGFGTNDFSKNVLIEGIKVAEKFKKGNEITVSYSSVKEKMIKELSTLEVPMENITISQLCQKFVENLSRIKTNCFPYILHKPSVKFDRMVNQQGLFIVQQYYQPDQYQKIQPTITIEIEKAFKETILNQLDSIGINRKYLFPDSDNISLYVTEKYSKNKSIYE
ncbi:FRG domain-containing protein [Streptococcus uberis]|uniref:FRG domain-containing protein n=1 Tax=Streptococcus uberis TaxID=1349 RepID=UPI001C9781A1|nr:FRG domain-containing protein [Streptococcus uberis]MBY4765373.1 FRG domain-containing protein [Streptococcus uberis]